MTTLGLYSVVKIKTKYRIQIIYTIYATMRINVIEHKTQCFLCSASFYSRTRTRRSGKQFLLRYYITYIYILCRYIHIIQVCFVIFYGTYTYIKVYRVIIFYFEKTGTEINYTIFLRKCARISRRSERTHAFIFRKRYGNATRFC